MNPSKLFPPYLNEGSTGAAVVFLQKLISAIDVAFPLEITGEHTGRSVEAVRRLQQNTLRMTEEDVDGNFGPLTRNIMQDELGISVDFIRAALDDVTNWTGPDHEGTKLWPEVK